MTLVFAPDGVEAVAEIAFEVNRTTQNIGARRLHTILERVVEEVSFDGPDLQVCGDGRLTWLTSLSGGNEILLTTPKDSRRQVSRQAAAIRAK